MGKPAARIGDMHTCPMVTGTVPHVGGPVSGPGVPTVLIGGMPAAVQGDMCVCCGPPDTVAMGSSGVFIGGKPAARQGDSTGHGGVIIVGLPTVLIGETGNAQMDSCPCVDNKVPEMPHVEKMWQSLKHSNAGTEVLNELGGPGGIAKNIGISLATGVVADVVIAAALAFPVTALAIGGIALIAAATVGRSAVEDFAGELIQNVKEGIEAVKKGADHLSDFYEETKVANSCQQLKEAVKSFDESVKILGPTIINAAIDHGSGKLAKLGSAKKQVIAKRIAKATAEKEAKNAAHTAIETSTGASRFIVKNEKIVSLGSGKGNWGRLKSTAEFSKKYEYLNVDVENDLVFKELGGFGDPRGRDYFWENYNKPYLDKHLDNGTKIQLFDDPDYDMLILEGGNSAKGETFFGREMKYLLKEKGYKVDYENGWLIPPSAK